MKFFNLFKKELRELVTLQALVSVLICLVVFTLLGKVMEDIGGDITSKMGSVVLADEDQSGLSKQAVDLLTAAGFEVTELSPADDVSLVEQAESYDHTSVLVIPEGFAAGIEAAEPQQLRIISKLNSFAMVSSSDSSAASAAQMIQQGLTTQLIQQHSTGDVAAIQSLITTSDTTVANGKTSEVNASLLQSMAMQQSIFIPIVVFLLITFATQLNASAIANEKGDKTLETLLSAPVSRLSVLGAKMCASGILSLLMAAVYMIGFSSYMGGMTGGMTGSAGMPDMGAAMQSLGLSMSPLQYVLLGIQLFLTLMIALAASMILGALAKDIKSASSLMMPLVFLAMIPYLVSMLMDVSSLPLPLQILLYLIPFTHTFTASANLAFGHHVILYAGMAYQVVLLVAVMALAVHIFSTDKIFTMTLDFSKKGKRKKVQKA